MANESQPSHLPPRKIQAMNPQPLIAWTPGRIIRSFFAWLMEEQELYGIPK